MKKIGILTFQNAHNYGAALQAYALKNMIGNGCEVVNYHNEYFKNNSYKINSEKNLIKKILRMIYMNQFKQRANRFEEFQNKFITDGSPMIKDEDLSLIDNKYDVFITGSDQVWNLECSGYNKTYFLNFVSDSEKKNSYAASFGSDNLSKENLSVSKDLLNDFNNIGVREKSGQKIIKDLIGRDVPVVLDPTMLLSKDDWGNLTGNRTNSKKYILVYTVLNGNKIIDYAKNLARKLGVDVYCITTSLKPQKGVKSIRNAGPIEWLNLIKDAEAIVTNSFHGLAFSLIYNKQFYIELLPPPAQTNARIKELLECVELTDRVIDENNNITEVSKNKIDYNKVNMILDKRRKESIDYLKKVIE